MFAGNYAPGGWHLCDGSILPIAGNETLFKLIGTTYGGDGQSTFAVPDLRGRVPIHQAPEYPMAQPGGSSEVQITHNYMPAHAHQMFASSLPANRTGPQGNVVAAALNTVTFYSSPPGFPMSPLAITGAPGNNRPHENTQPYLCVNFIIALSGIFPSQS
jgi:microcystin-dependent protein